MGIRLPLAIAILMGVSWIAPARAEDKPLDRAEIDRRAAKAVYDTTITGTELFNAGNYEGCFRLYQGCLVGIQPALDHRPKLLLIIKEKLEKAKGLKPAEGAFVLREALDAVQKETAPALVKP